MTEYAKRQMYVDSIVTQAINGEVPKEKAIEAQKEFEKRQSETLISDMKSTYSNL